MQPFALIAVDRQQDATSNEGAVDRKKLLVSDPAIINFVIRLAGFRAKSCFLFRGEYN